MRNALLSAKRWGRVSMDGAAERLDSLRTLPILTDQEADLQTAFVLAREHGLFFYDALYLELVKRRKAPLATLDIQLARAATAERVELPPT